MLCMGLPGAVFGLAVPAGVPNWLQPRRACQCCGVARDWWSLCLILGALATSLLAGLHSDLLRPDYHHDCSLDLPQGHPCWSSNNVLKTGCLCGAPH